MKAYVKRISINSQFVSSWPGSFLIVLAVALIVLVVALVVLGLIVLAPVAVVACHSLCSYPALAQ